jgi:hypothetical protein
MTVALVAAGVVILAVTFVDVVWTTVAAGSGAGPLTGRMSRMLWRTALRVDRRTNASLLTPAGVAIVMTILAAWIGMIMLGWLLVFSASGGAVRAATTGVPGDLADRVLFVGYTVLTLGLGNFVPGQGAWQFATVVATGSGLLLVTLSVTYLIPVASAVVQRRQLAGQISSLGRSSYDIVTNGWNGSDFGSLGQNLSMLLPSLHSLRLQHLSYPVLHVFHTRSTHDSAAISLTHLDGAVGLLRSAVDPDVRPDTQTLDAVAAALGEFLDTMDGIHIDDGPEPVPAPSLTPLIDAGIPVDQSRYEHAVEGSERRRRLLASYLHDDGWSTEDLGS